MKNYETWQQLVYKNENKTFIDDDLLKKIIMRMYYYNYKNVIIKNQDIDHVDRELCKSIIFGEYRPEGVIFSVKGSPPKGSIYVINYEREDQTFYYDNSKMKKLVKGVDKALAMLFRKQAENILHKWYEINALPKPKIFDWSC